MKSVRLHTPSLLAGCGLALLVMTTLAQKAAAPAAPAAASVEFRIVDDPEQDDLGKLASEGWEYAGYLGQGKKGSGNDQTLWKRATK